MARQGLEARLGAHAAELADKDTQVAYLSSVVDLAQGLLTAKQRCVTHAAHAEVPCAQPIPQHDHIRGRTEVSSQMRVICTVYAPDYRPSEVDMSAHRKVEELSGESLGLQDVLLEAGAEAAAGELRLRQLEAELGQQREQLHQLQKLLTEREAQLAQCRADLARAQRQLAGDSVASASPESGIKIISFHTPGTVQDR